MKTIDMTSVSWGHNINMMTNDGEGHLRFAIWCTPGPEAGDELVYEVSQGVVKARVDEVERVWGVSDMSYINITVTERIPRV